MAARDASLSDRQAGLPSHERRFYSRNRAFGRFGIRQFRPWFEPVPRDLQVLENLALAFPESGEVWAKSVTLGENNKVSCSGFAQNQSAWLSFLERLRKRKDVSHLQVQQVRGEKPIQFSIVYKWEVNTDGK